MRVAAGPIFLFGAGPTFGPAPSPPLFASGFGDEGAFFAGGAARLAAAFAAACDLDAALPIVDGAAGGGRFFEGTELMPVPEGEGGGRTPEPLGIGAGATEDPFALALAAALPLSGAFAAATVGSASLSTSSSGS
ncbi:MAG: hypothetical protein AAGK78_09945 [Planctomycetota bacterium]